MQASAGLFAKPAAPSPRAAAAAAAAAARRPETSGPATPATTNSTAAPAAGGANSARNSPRGANGRGLSGSAQFRLLELGAQSRAIEERVRRLGPACASDPADGLGPGPG
jgi:hypothetical protein